MIVSSRGVTPSNLLKIGDEGAEASRIEPEGTVFTTSTQRAMGRVSIL
jgi:hypothetical protein